jgi:hypothetical protein
VLTVHKAQGSQWDDVVLFDESFAFPDNRERWLYTGITRAGPGPGVRRACLQARVANSMSPSGPKRTRGHMRVMSAC